MIDVHCHLTEKPLVDDLDNVIKEAKNKGVKAIVTSGIGPEDCKHVLEIADNQYVFPSLGIEPYELDGYEEVIELIRKERNRVIMIGEVGLDYYAAPRDTWEIQRRVFIEFIELSKELDKPLVIHSRSAGRYAVDILIQNKAERVIMHAFDGKPSHAERGAQHGYLFSIPPSVARSEQKQKLVKRLPLENLLLESDAPVLAPERNMVNKPSNIKVSAEWIAKLKGIKLEAVIEETEQQAREILRI
ncbi:MAG TPA: TatD family deoxyribonuclease [Candidatus Caldiarchaeum subterraneum]|uniref:TatD family deoxyribonuclease n=1 Tax=Caldiarchaeum subterraneum TaxID=311458 RepID=A0A833E9E4_CALS0|nr:TatD family deoxyribonuclease [Candidatus Caldarchaeum subterraneum]